MHARTALFDVRLRRRIRAFVLLISFLRFDAHTFPSPAIAADPFPGGCTSRILRVALLLFPVWSAAMAWSIAFMSDAGPESGCIGDEGVAAAVTGLSPIGVPWCAARFHRMPVDRNRQKRKRTSMPPGFPPRGDQNSAAGIGTHVYAFCWAFPVNGPRSASNDRLVP